MKKILFFLPIIALLLTSCHDDQVSKTLEDTASVKIEVITNESNNSIQLSLSGNNPTIDWGDGEIQKLEGTTATSVEHTYETGSTAYTIKITDNKLQIFGVEKDDDNLVKDVKFANTPSLRFVRLLEVGSISNLDFSACPVLQEVYITKSALKSLDLTNHKSIQSVKLISNPELSSLKLSSKIKTLGLDSNPKLSISELGLSQLIMLEDLLLTNMDISSIDLGANLAIKNLDVSDNSLSDINISKLAAIESLKCNDNQLLGITLGVANIKLKNVECIYNQLDKNKIESVFTALPIRLVNDNATIDITGNSGATTSDQTIAVSKNWTIHNS